jgi:Fur family ferric uptake transcriptional regulator
MLEKSSLPWPEGLKRTKPREAVLAVFEEASEPLTALAISSNLEKNGRPLWLSTIYRILESFEEKGLISKTTVLDNGMAVYAVNRHEHTHYAVCMKCRKMLAMEKCPMQADIPELSNQGFQVTGHKIEMYGYCRECSEKDRG